MRGVGFKVAALIWLSLILFSSTSAAGIWSDFGFHWIASHFMRQLHEDTPAYDNASFAAEKSFHLLMFTVLALLVWRILPAVPWKFAVVFSIGLTVGIASELFQRHFPGRDPTIRDALINASGTALGAISGFALSRRAAKSQPV